MAIAGGAPDLLLLIACFFAVLLGTDRLPGAAAVKFTFRNNCPETVWPASQTNADRPAFPTTGFALPPGASVSFPNVSATWSGRLWGRYGCTGVPGADFSCASGDCGTRQLACNGAGGTPPATLAELTLAAAGTAFYDISNVDGFNLPVAIEPATAGCPSPSCPADINRVCPSELAVRGGTGGAVVGCKSACLAFMTDEYCCRGKFGSPETCKPSKYSRLFKAQCPQAYSYAYDDRSSTFTCNGGGDYQITFCPAPAH